MLTQPPQPQCFHQGFQVVQKSLRSSLLHQGDRKLCRVPRQGVWYLTAGRHSFCVTVAILHPLVLTQGGCKPGAQAVRSWGPLPTFGSKPYHPPNKNPKKWMAQSPKNDHWYTVFDAFPTFRWTISGPGRQRSPEVSAKGATSLGPPVWSSTDGV